MPLKTGCVMVAGDSHAGIFGSRVLDRANEGDLPDAWSEAILHHGFLNRGIGGETSRQIQHRAGELLRHQPTELILFVGTNDAGQNLSPDGVIRLIETLAGSSRVIVPTIMPVSVGDNGERNRIGAVLNTAVRQAIHSPAVTFINTAPLLADSSGLLRGDCTYDGIHLNVQGCDLLIDAIAPHL